MTLFITIAGWIGMALIVGAYFLVSKKMVASTDPRYQAMNLVGSVAVGIYVFQQRAWPAFTLQLIWGIIALWSLLRPAKE